MKQHLHGFSLWNLPQVPQNLHKLHKPWAPLGSPELLSTPLSSLNTFRTWNLSGTCYRFCGTCMIFEKPWAKRRVMNSDYIASHGGTCCRFRGTCTYFTRKSPNMVKQSCTDHHRTLDFPMKNNSFSPRRKSAGSKEPVSIRTFYNLEPVWNLLQVPRKLHNFREALGEMQVYGCRPVLY